MLDQVQVTALVIAARSGDRAAFARLAEDFNRAVSAVIMGELLCSSDELQDLLQDVWLAGWNGLPRLKEPERFVPWLYSVARNRTRTARKKRRRDQDNLYLADADSAADSPLEAAVASGDSDPADAVTGADLLREALRQLPPKERVAFYLRAVTEPPWEYLDISRALGTAEISARVAYSRACKRLADWWNRDIAG